MPLSWSEIVNDGTPLTGLTGPRAMSEPPELDPAEEAAYERFMAGMGMEPSQLVTPGRPPLDPEDRVYAEFMQGIQLFPGGLPPSVRRR
jgi:hypothetical protein